MNDWLSKGTAVTLALFFSLAFALPASAAKKHGHKHAKTVKHATVHHAPKHHKNVKHA